MFERKSYNFIVCYHWEKNNDKGTSYYNEVVSRLPFWVVAFWEVYKDLKNWDEGIVRIQIIKKSLPSNVKLGFNRNDSSPI